MKLKVKESEIQKQIIDWCEYQGWFVVRVQNIGIPLQGGGFRPPKQKGLPDLFVFIPRTKGCAVPIAIEVKSSTGRLSEAQERTLADLDLIGVQCIVARSLDFVQEKLKQYL